jgi:oligopeptide transport system substrate-binding protein
VAQIKTFYQILIVATMLLLSSFVKAEEPVFRVFLSSPPLTMNPAQLYGTESTYLVSNLFRGLYRVDSKKGLIPEGAESCEWFGVRNFELECKLNPNVKWSDGVPVKSEDYVRAFQYLINPESKSREISHLLKLKNAKDILAGKRKPEELGIKAVHDFVLRFEFEEKDPEFLARLSSNVLIPWRVLPNRDKPEEILTNGPYKIKSLDNKKAYLVKNQYYPYGNPSRPDVEIFYIEESSTGQNLFDAGKLDLVHQLNPAFIPKYKNHKGMFEIDFTRFDYIGFGPDLQNDIHFRKALALSLNYEELKDILLTPRRPGCSGLTANYTDKPSCYDFDLELAKRELKKVPKNLLEKPLVMKFSRASAETLSRVMEWYQNQWQKNLGIKFSIESTEQGMYLQDLKLNPPAVFRKGVALDRPTCLSALETFQKDSPDNFIKFNNKKYEEILKKLGTEPNSQESKKNCEAGVKILMDEYRIIPQGILHYNMLKSDRFEGFEFNELNQLDLSNLKIKK